MKSMGVMLLWLMPMMASCAMPPGRMAEGEAPGPPPGQTKLGAIFGPDDRVPTSDFAVGRIYWSGSPNTSICTAFLTAWGVAATAGHCTYPKSRRPDMIEFNVPPSQTDGTPVRSAPQFSYMINTATMQRAPIQPGPDYFPVGADWALFEIYPNSVGSPWDRGQFFRLLEAPLGSSTSFPVGVTSFGRDSSTTGSISHRNTTEQTSTGVASIPAQLPDVIRHVVSTEEGSSGAPIYLLGTTLAVAIHNAGPGPIDANCSQPGNNCGTTFHAAALQSAFENFAAANEKRVYVDSQHPLGPGSGTLMAPSQTLEGVLDQTCQSPCVLSVRIVTGWYDGHGNKPASPGLTVIPPGNLPANPISLMATAGPVVIGSPSP